MLHRHLLFLVSTLILSSSWAANFQAPISRSPWDGFIYMIAKNGELYFKSIYTSDKIKKIKQKHPTLYLPTKWERHPSKAKNLKSIALVGHQYIMSHQKEGRPKIKITRHHLYSIGNDGKVYIINVQKHLFEKDSYNDPSLNIKSKPDSFKEETLNRPAVFLDPFQLPSGIKSIYIGVSYNFITSDVVGSDGKIYLRSLISGWRPIHPKFQPINQIKGIRPLTVSSANLKFRDLNYRVPIIQTIGSNGKVYTIFKHRSVNNKHVLLSSIILPKGVLAKQLLHLPFPGTSGYSTLLKNNNDAYMLGSNGKIYFKRLGMRYKNKLWDLYWGPKGINIKEIFFHQKILVDDFDMDKRKYETTLYALDKNNTLWSKLINDQKGPWKKSNMQPPKNLVR